MKNMKKLIALLLTFTLVMSMGIGAMAAPGDPEYDVPLTVTGLAEGDVAHFYQVIEWVGDAEGNVAGWKAVAPFDSYLTEENLTDILVGTPVADDPDTPEDESEASVPPTGITSEIAGEIAKLASGDGSVIEAVSGTATLQNTAPGMWMALIDPADAKTVYNPVFVSADYNLEGGGTVAVTDSFIDSETQSVAKSSTLKLEKEAEDETSVDSDPEHTTAVGDTVVFTVKTTIPVYGFVYDEPHFAVKDELTGLEVDIESVKVTTPEGLVKGTDYTVEDTSTGYTLTFNEDYLKGLLVATDVVIEYKAIVTSAAEYAVNEESNDVVIEFSHKPNEQDDYSVLKDTTQHYTFSIDAEGAGSGEDVSGKKTSELVKIGVNADGTPITQVTETSAITSTETWTGPLDGAVFGLYTAKSEEAPYIPKNADGTPGTEPMTAITGTDGRLSFTGLDAGTYYLREISAPAGFVTDSKTYHEIVIAAETETVSVTEWWNGSEWVDTKPTSGTAKEVTYDTDVLKSYTVTIDGKLTAKYTFTNAEETTSNEINWEEAELEEHPFELENPKGTELPSTGGIGTTMFYVVGSVLVIGAVVLLISKRRMNAR